MRIRLLLLTVLAALPPAAEAQTSRQMPLQRASQGGAFAELKTREGQPAGTAILTETPSGVLIQVQAKGFTPGVRAFHIHETGKCEAPDFKTAGAHFNPEGKRHGFKNPHGAHAGDMANLVVAADGTAKAEVLVPGLKLKEGPHALLRKGGTALVIHAQADDYQTDPAGAAGDRVACGVIMAR
jgi:Cu-Zn family superoxide dismutase